MDTFSNQRKRMYTYNFKNGLKILNGFYIENLGTFYIKKGYILYITNWYI